MAQFLSVLGAIAVAALGAASTYLFTKWREREAEIRKEKMEHYKELIHSLNLFLASVSPSPSSLSIFAGLEKYEGWQEGINSTASVDEAKGKFTAAANKSFIIASNEVVVALMALLDALKDSTTAEDLRWQAVNRLIEKIRFDLGVSKSSLPISIKLAA
ncbi:MAG: hypothetical protein ACTH5D_05225 [Halomonas sp.]|uniref:hypothetical protein n=1 Tax=Halomonas sp. TaxID=1486246 RepID=UPI003F92C08D